MATGRMATGRRDFHSTSAYFARRAAREHNAIRRKRFEDAAEHYRLKALDGGAPDETASRTVSSATLKPRRQRLIELFRNAPVLR